VVHLCTADVTKTHHTYVIQLKDSVESGGSEVEVGRFVSSEGFRHHVALRVGGCPFDDRGYFLDTNSDPKVCKFKEEERVNISNFLACTRERSYINY